MEDKSQGERVEELAAGCGKAGGSLEASCLVNWVDTTESRGLYYTVLRVPASLYSFRF